MAGPEFSGPAISSRSLRSAVGRSPRNWSSYSYPRHVLRRGRTSPNSAARSKRVRRASEAKEG